MRLQGFPDDYRFVGSRDDAIKQIGNSVSPKLAHQLALAIAQQLLARAVEIPLLPVSKQLSFDKRKGEKAQRTRQLHHEVNRSNMTSGERTFLLEDYTALIRPTATMPDQHNMIIEAQRDAARITVRADQSQQPFATMILDIHPGQKAFHAGSSVTVEVRAYGEVGHTVQTMWNAVDDWVIRSSGFHSLFELYGHFTEPHPIFMVREFTAHSKQPIAAFAKHVSSFTNCSRYFPREHLTRLFGTQFNAPNFLDLVSLLRRFRFDIRCHETNRTIPQDVYMVSYPFTLPFGKQMNFALRPHPAVETVVERQLRLIH